TAVKDEYFRLSEARGLKWCRSSETGRRGFCQECGSVLFWKGDGRDHLAAMAGDHRAEWSGDLECGGPAEARSGLVSHGLNPTSLLWRAPRHVRVTSRSRQG